MSARDSILAKVRASLGTAGEPAARMEAVSARLTSHAPGIIPARGQIDAPKRVKLFAEMAEKANATVQRVRSSASVPKAVSSYLRSHNLPAAIRLGLDPRLTAMGWQEQKALTVKTGPSDGFDEAGVSHAFGGIAETGTLMLTSGPDNPTTINFLPDHHIVVINEADIAGDIEALWSALRARGMDMPRTVNFITGPSRSGDIEQTLLLGAHGPRALHIIIVGGAAGP